MSDLRDKLLKAGLVSAEQAKQAEVDTRETARPRGREGQGPRADASRNEGPRGERREGQGPRNEGPRGDRREGQGPRTDGARNDGPRGERRDGGRPRRDEGRRQDGERAAPSTGGAPGWVPVEPLALAPEEAERLRKLVHAGKVEGKTRGHRRWYYLARNGSVPYLELSDEAAKDLESGATALAENDRGDAALVTRECAETLAATDPGWIRVWARG